MNKRQMAVSAATVYGVGVVAGYRVTGLNGVLSRPVRAVMAAGWPGIVAGVGIALIIQVIGDKEC